MNKSWLGPAVVGVIVVGIVGFLFLNIETGRPTAADPGSPGDKPAVASPGDAPSPGTGAPVREYPIGDEVRRNHIQVAAVWLPAVMMDGMAGDPNDHVIHIEADVKSLEGNPNGFAKDEKIYYLKVAYSVQPAEGGTPIASGELTPMMARDGFHYGANIALPKPGKYRLVYDLQPPSAGGLGRHSDAATGVAPWWEPFQATFDWTVEPDAAKVTAR